MQSRNSAHISKLKPSSDLQKLVLVLCDDTLRSYARGVTITTSHATFNVDRHAGIRICIEQLCKEELSHSFGAVLATGTTVFSGPYSYVIVFVDQLDNPEVLVNGEALVAHGDDIELGRVESSVKQLPRPGVAITKTTVVATSPAELASPVEPTIPNDANILFEERYDKWGQDAILAIYKYKGLSFDDTNFQLLIDTLRKHNTEEWKALRLLQEITQKDELARFILRDATLSEPRRRVIMREVRARGVKWTPAFHEEIETTLDWGESLTIEYQDIVYHPLVIGNAKEEQDGIEQSAEIAKPPALRHPEWFSVRHGIGKIWFSPPPSYQFNWQSRGTSDRRR
ncbi:uncharacterized protein ALTATR162_LOCUS452 [Alternaria atra]|uniref:Uncharacterized protein n=1 Tax=Alternaria atra TaxID=119953 RepID=A0A8J2HVC2_9PLEO|nr:uncharacterized protein ALTATR162_LOCUS452 [Alternaria atra]CAG5138852.1 unnamed protein product [Alternaria atra]